MDEIAIKIFAAQHQISEEAAKSIMYMYGLEAEYINVATILEPVFNEAYQDGQTVGAEFVGVAAELAMFHAQRGASKSPNYDEGFRDGAWTILNAVREAVDDVAGPVEVDTDVILDHIPHEIADGETLQSVLAAYFSGVAPTR